MMSSERSPIDRMLSDLNYRPHSSDNLFEIPRGSVVRVSRNKNSVNMFQYDDIFDTSRPETGCAFDFSYLRYHGDERIRNFRKELGRLLWENDSLNVNSRGKKYVAVPVLNSGVYYAEGYGNTSGIGVVNLISIKEDYDPSMRSFQEATQEAREAAARAKYKFFDSYKG